MVEVKVLGSIRGFRDGEPLDLGGPTQRKLLASLVARPGEVVSVASLLEALWGDDPPPSGPQSIQSYVSRLRRELGQLVIQTKAPGYQLNLEEVDLDSSRFLEMVRDLPLEPDDRLERIEEALRLWTGPPFEDFEHVDFASRHLIDSRFGLEEQRAHLLAEAGSHGEAIAVLQRIAAAEPLRESAWIALSEILVAAGRQAEAVRTLDGYRRKLADIGLEPGPAFAMAQDAVFEGPKPRAPSPLPRVETTFIGRERELVELQGLLRENRLVTVTGPGGMGKSRLAIQALTEWTDLPVTVTRLASLGDDREVGPAVLHAVGGEARGDAIEAVVARVGRAPTLLLLDNAEHVIEATARLASQILTRTEGRMLVTTREPLNVLGEVVVSLDSLEPASAIELFIDRARQANPHFEAAAATLDILCEELDYMPLAIEMAAARSKALPPDEILTRLGTRFGLLDKPLRGGTGRHRSLDTLVEWSYGLLHDTEQRVFERLSIVAGPFDVGFATDLAGFGDVEPEQVPGALAGLVEKSLVNRMPTGAYRILRVLKSYAKRMLEASGDGARARTIHSRLMADLATKIGEGLSTPNEIKWVDNANRVVDDLTAALRWAVHANDLDVAQDVLEGLFDWFYHRHPPAITEWGDMVLPHAEGHDVASVANAWAAVAAIKRGDLVRGPRPGRGWHHGRWPGRAIRLVHGRRRRLLPRQPRGGSRRIQKAAGQGRQRRGWNRCGRRCGRRDDRAGISGPFRRGDRDRRRPVTTRFENRGADLPGLCAIRHGGGRYRRRTGEIHRLAGERGGSRRVGQQPVHRGDGPHDAKLGAGVLGPSRRGARRDRAGRCALGRSGRAPATAGSPCSTQERSSPSWKDRRMP